MLACSGDGVLYTWGRGTSGNLGHGDFQDVPTPRYVTSLSTKNTLQVASGRNFTLALTGVLQLLATQLSKW